MSLALFSGCACALAGPGSLPPTCPEFPSCACCPPCLYPCGQSSPQTRCVYKRAPCFPGTGAPVGLLSASTARWPTQLQPASLGPPPPTLGGQLYRRGTAQVCWVLAMHMNLASCSWATSTGSWLVPCCFSPFALDGLLWQHIGHGTASRAPWDSAAPDSVAACDSGLSGLRPLLRSAAPLCWLPACCMAGSSVPWGLGTCCFLHTFAWLVPLHHSGLNADVPSPGRCP